MYQAHLEQIGDFLICGKEVWWHTDEESKEVIFHDSKGQPEFRDQGPPIHHFHSSSFHSGRLYLERKWNKCLAQGDLLLPIKKVKVYDPSGAVVYTECYRMFLDDLWMITEMMKNTKIAFNVLTTQMTHMNQSIKNPSMKNPSAIIW